MLLENPSRTKAIKILAAGTALITIIDVIQTFLFIPMYIHFFGERLYGLWVGSGGLIAALTFVDMGIGNLVVQRVAKAYGQKNFNSISKYFSTGLCLHLLLMSLLFITSLFIGNQLINIFKFDTSAELQNIKFAFRVASLALVFTLINGIIEGCLQSLQLPLFGRTLNVFSALIGAIISFYLMVNGYGVASISIGLVSRSLISLLPNSIYLYIIFGRNNLKFFYFDWLILNELIRLSISQLISSLGGAIVNNIEPVIINIFVSPQMAVFFSVNKKVSSLIRSTLDKIGGILFPSVAHMHASETKLHFSKFMLRFIQVIIPLSFMLFMVGALLNENFIKLWINEKQYLGDLVNWTISGALFISFIMAISFYLLAAVGDIVFTNMFSLLESAIKIILIFVFLYFFGIVGLPLALLFSSSIMLLIVAKRWRKHLEISFEQQKQILRTILLGFSTTTVICFFIYILIYFLGSLNMYDFIIFSFFVIVVNFIAFTISNNEVRYFATLQIRRLLSGKNQL